MTVPLESAELIFEGYRLVRQLRPGAQGRVFQANRVIDGLQVALKLYDLPTDSKQSEQARRRHARECKLLRAVSSAAIVRIIDAGEHLEAAADRSGSLWTAFEFVDGLDLRDMMKRRPVELEKVVTSLSTMAEGIHQVHSAKGVHRDIKPENVILRGKKWNAPVLVDFGYAKTVDASRLTRTGFQVGTRSYTAPEIQRGAKAEAASDQWSFARLSAELILWARGEDASDIRDGVGAQEDILDRFSDCGSTAGVLGRALESEPEDRYEDVSDFSSALEEALYADELLQDDRPAGNFAGQHWDRRKPLKAYLQDIGFRVVDNRPRQGSLWVISGDEFQSVSDYLLGRGVRFEFRPGGGRASGHRPGWYTKDNA